MIQYVCTVNWGSVAEWVGGIATASAVAIALFFSRRQDRAEHEQRVAAVFAWPEMVELDGGRSWRVVVSNCTDYPIYDWEVILSWVAPTGDEFSETLDSGAFGIALPGKNGFRWDDDTVPLPEADSQVRVRLSFVDASGQQRVREHTRGASD